MTTAIVFPGQGAQFAKMTDAYLRHPAVAETVAEASALLGEDLAAIINDGDKLTENAQPIMLAMDVGVYRAAVGKFSPPPMVMAGHSLGEYASLVCADVLSFADAVLLVRQRAIAMRDSASDGAMAAVIGLSAATVEEVCKRQKKVWAANYNAPQQTVIAGLRDDVLAAMAELKSCGAKRVLRLPVGAPSHCPLMESAVKQFAPYLQKAAIKKAAIKIVHNADAQTASTAAGIIARLSAQLINPVRWTDTVLYLQKSGVRRVYECGPGKTLSGLIKRIAPALETFSLSDDAALFALGESQK